MDAAARQECIREVKILQSLDHPNIIRCHASFIQVGASVWHLQLPERTLAYKLTRMQTNARTHACMLLLQRAERTC